MTADTPTLAALIWQAVTAPEDTDRGALLKIASDFLDAAQGGEPTVLDSARRMAYAAMDWAFFGSDKALDKLKIDARCFRMMSRVMRAAKLS